MAAIVVDTEEDDVQLASVAPDTISAAAAAASTSAVGAVASGGAEATGAIQVEEPEYAAMDATLEGVVTEEVRSIRVPQNRYTPLRDSWESLVTPLVQHMKLQVRFNPTQRCVELKSSEFTTEKSALQKGEDFIRAFLLGFEVEDAIALLRMDDLYIESFEVHDVKMLKGEHLSRAIGRIAGHEGKTKFAVENATRTRIVVADSKIHILGAFTNIQVARDAVCSLILGTPPGKVYNHMRQVSARMAQRY
ncbi:PNO1 [Symbiodinium sp. KB8]|nr:PNO1 [Symbiodinium sp. KB8]